MRNKLFIFVIIAVFAILCFFSSAHTDAASDSYAKFNCRLCVFISIVLTLSFIVLNDFSPYSAVAFMRAGLEPDLRRCIAGLYSLFHSNGPPVLNS